jgi:hypothetical protein
MKDPFFDQVEFLFPCKYDNQGTQYTFRDLSNTPKSISRYGDTLITKSQSKHYGSALYVDGTGDYIRADTALDSLTSIYTPFTIEFWIKSSNDDLGVLGINRSSDGINILISRLTNVQSWNGSDHVSTGYSPGASTNVWNHFAFVNTGDAYPSVYINGTFRCKHTVRLNTALSDCVLGFGAEFDAANGGTPGNYMNAYYNDIRITSGVARYTSDFTPPGPLIDCYELEQRFDSPVNYWKMEDTQPFVETDPNVSLLLPMFGENNGTTFTNYSSKNITISRFGTPITSTDENKYYDSSAYFDGSGDYLTLSNGSDYAFGTGDFTVEFWSYLSSYGISVDEDRTIFGTSSGSGGGGLFFYLNFSDGAPRVWDGTTGISSVITIPLNTWTHVSFTRKSGTLYIFVNGVIGNQASYTTNVTKTTGWVVGGNSNANNTRYFHGHLQDLRVTKGVARYTADFTPPSKFYYNYYLKDQRNSTNLFIEHDNTPEVNGAFEVADKGSELYNNDGGYIYDPLLLIHSDNINGSTTFTDSSGNNIALTANGNVQHSTAQQKFGESSIAFDGAGDYITGGNIAALNFGDSDFTIDFWVWLSGAGSGTIRNLVQQTPSTSYAGWNVLIPTDNKLTFSSANYSSSPWFSLSSSSAIPHDEWVHCAIVRSSGTQYLFVNGVGVAPAANPDYITTTSGLNIGRDGQLGRYLNGYIDELRITNTAEWTANFTPPTSPYRLASYLQNQIVNYRSTDTQGTIELWFKFNSINTNNNYFLYSPNSTNSALFALMHHNTGKFRLLFHDNSVEHIIETNESGYADDKWHHLAVTQSGTEINFWVDFQKLTTTIVSNIPNDKWFFSIAGRDSLSIAYPYFDGALDDFSVYNRVLSDTEIMQHYYYNKELKSYNRYEDLVLSHSPISYWRFDTNGLIEDKVGEYHLNNSGEISYSLPIIANDTTRTLNYDGVNDVSYYYKAGTGSGNSPVTSFPFTLEFWCYDSFRFQTNATNTNYCGVMIDSPTSLLFGDNTGAGEPDRKSYTNYVRLLNMANHVCMIFTGHGEFETYVNVQRVGNVYTAGTATYTQLGVGYFRIGTINTNWTSYFSGELGELAVYDYVLSHDRILEHYKCGKHVSKYELEVIKDVPVNWWKLNENVGIDHHDFVPDNTKLIDLQSYNTPLLSQTSPVYGEGDEASILFNGTDQYLTADVSGFRSSDTQGSIEYWIKTDTNQNGWVFSSCQNTLGNYISLGMIAGTITIQSSISGSSYGRLYTNNVFNDNSWHHVIVTYDDLELKIYVDSILQDCSTDGTETIHRWFNDIANRTNVNIGANVRDYIVTYFSGQISNVVVYNYPLTEDRIQAHYKAAGYSNYSNKVLSNSPTHYFKMDESVNTGKLTDQMNNINMFINDSPGLKKMGAINE